MSRGTSRIRSAVYFSSIVDILGIEFLDRIAVSIFVLYVN